MDIKEIIKKVTVDSKDNQHRFVVNDRIEAISEILSSSPYRLIHEGKLCLIYGKREVKDESVVLISSHIDCVYDRLFCQDDHNDCLLGTFDNSLTNACVIKDMLDDRLNDNVIIAFTGDEEEDSKGANEVTKVMESWNTTITTAIVLDLTEEGWTEISPFTIEKDLGIDLMKAHHIVELLKPYEGKYKFVHDAEPDESWEYDEEEIPSFSLCIPTYGDMHSDSGSLVRQVSLPVYCEVLAMLANELSGSHYNDITCYAEFEGQSLCGLYANEEDCRSDNYVAVRTRKGLLTLPSNFHGVPITKVKDFLLMINSGRKKSPAIKGLVIPESYEYIGEKDFSGYKSLEVLYLPQNVMLSSWAFAYCEKLSKVYVGVPDKNILWEKSDKKAIDIYILQNGEQLQVVYLKIATHN